MLQIRKAKPEDLQQIMPLYEKAREFMAKNGNPTQWGKNNPPENLIRKDIEEGYFYVAEDEEIELAFHFHVGEEPNYKEIYKGAWHRNEAYGVIHRVVSSGKIPGRAHAYRGYSSARYGSPDKARQAPPPGKQRAMQPPLFPGSRCA